MAVWWERQEWWKGQAGRGGGWWGEAGARIAVLHGSITGTEC